MFLTDQQILNSVADLLKYSAAQLPAYWTNIVTEQHAAAYNYMLGKLLNRGFLQSQIQQWDQGPYYERQLSIFFVITDAAATTDSFNPQSLMLRDVRKELDTVLLSVNGAFVQPGATGDEPGTVGYGEQEDCGIFPWPDREYLRRERW